MAVYPIITNNVNINLSSDNYNSAIFKKFIFLYFDKSGYTITDLSFKYYNSSSKSYVEFYTLSSLTTSTDLVTVSTSALIPVPDDLNSVPIRITYKSVVNGKTYNVTKDGTATLNTTDRSPTLTVSVEHFVIAQTKTSLTGTLGSGYNVTTYGQVDISLKGTAFFGGDIKQYDLVLKNSEAETYNTIIGDSISSTTTYFKINKNITGEYTLSVTATDNRGNVSETYTTTFTVLSYSIPTTAIIATRENGYEKETAITIKNPTISPLTINGVNKNEIVSIIYKYKASSDSTAWEDIAGQSVSISNNLAEVTTIYQEFDDTTEYIVRVYVTDKVTTVYAENILTQGIPVMVESTDGHISIGMVPDFESESLLQVASDIMATDVDGNRRNILEEIDGISTNTNTLETKTNTLETQYTELKTKTDKINRVVYSVSSHVTSSGKLSSYSGYFYIINPFNLVYIRLNITEFTEAFAASSTGVTICSFGTDFAPPVNTALACYSTKNVQVEITSSGELKLMPHAATTTATDVYISGFYPLNGNSKFFIN